MLKLAKDLKAGDVFAATLQGDTKTFFVQNTFFDKRGNVMIRVQHDVIKWARPDDQFDVEEPVPTPQRGPKYATATKAQVAARAAKVGALFTVTEYGFDLAAPNGFELSTPGSHYHTIERGEESASDVYAYFMQELAEMTPCTCAYFQAGA